jgi:hypothetical protein
MNTDSSPQDGRGDAASELPAWEDCDLFCIHEYAGTGAPPCGWRGRLRETPSAPFDRPRADPFHNLRERAGQRCPRCRCATLFYLPLNLSLPENPGTPDAP